MTVTIYKSTDGSAPVLSGQAGKLVDLLDAILVNGYGAKPSQGWSIAYTDTNKRVYRLPTGTTQFYLRVDDTGTTDGRLRGWEVKADINDSVDANNTGPFPTDAQVSGGLYMYKSSTANATARAWQCYGNGKIFYLNIDVAGDGSTLRAMAFGDFTSYKSGDAYNCIIIANNSVAGARFPLLSNNSALTGHYVPRSYTQSGGSLNVGKHSAQEGGTSGMGYAGITYPNAADTMLYIGRVVIHEVTGYVQRGFLPGCWSPCHARPIAHFDTYAGAGALSGKTFESINSWEGSIGACQVHYETSDTW